MKSKLIVRADIIRPLLAAGIMLAMVFTFNCSSGEYKEGDGGGGGGGVTGGSDGGGNQNSQVYNKDGSLYNGSGVIKISTSKPDTLIDAGNVTNGKVSLQLPSTMDSKYLSDNFGCTKSSDIKAFIQESFRLTSSSGEVIGKLMLASGKEAIFYGYFSSAGKIVCNSESENVNIKAQAGWNKIYFIDGHPDEASTDNILTQEVKWTFSPAKDED